ELPRAAPSGQQQYQYLHRRGAANAEVAEAMRVRVFLCVLCVLCASAPLRWKLFFSSAVATRLPLWAARRPSHKPVSCVAGRAKRGGATDVKPRIYYTKPSITELEVGYATDAARNGWGERCYDYIHRFEAQFREHLGVRF